MMGVDERMLGTIEVTHERAEAALVLHHLLLTISVPLIDEDDAYAGIQNASSRSRCSSVS